ncbi:hypothetical protein [Mucilaginibacter aquaedulcis]|uniref:hypothetical protein n=1 Tax=Mucilaginibacter aquaedulcis TaxID=1187081 RepID=UPI0025B59234|nr:hypothetical protein [Mucilaginibacter aquaedulcis]MDN3548950.1 hypothetical protein [Mucilaginibacter aquaedulcis]
MKNFIKDAVRIYCAIAMLTALCSMSGCNGSKKIDDPVPATPQVDCTPKTNTVTANINGFDNSPTAAFPGLPVAIFHISQTVTTYNAISCGSNSASNTLVIQNPTPARITFGFQITVLNSLNAIQWQYQNVAIIPPNSMIDLGEVSKSQYGLTLPTGKIIIQSQRVLYQ